MQELIINKILQGDTLEVLKTLPDESVDCIVTSPPYYGLRDYGTAKWEGGSKDCDHKIPETESDPKYPQSGSHIMRFNREACYKCGAKRIDRQVGLEKSLNEYLDKMLLITAELKRVLKKTGTMWWNHGDSYANRNPVRQSGSQPAAGTKKNESKTITRTYEPNYPEKSLMLQAHRLAIRMVDEQEWVLRNQIIWHKPNIMPSSVKDRFTVDYEPIFFFSKSKRYWFETQYEEAVWDLDGNGTIKRKERAAEHLKSFPTNERNGIRPSIRVVYPNGKYKDGQQSAKFVNRMRNKRAVWKITTKPFKEAHFATFPEALIETPIKAGCPMGGVTLDPFMGAGTTAVVAKKLGRNYLGIELNPEYIKIAEKRIGNVPQSLFIEPCKASHLF